MQPARNESEATPPRSMPTTGKDTDIASASLPDTLAALHVNPETGLTHGEVDTRRKEHGYNEVAEQKEHPVLKFLGKFWGLSAWMLELIMILSLVLRTLLRSRHCGRIAGRQCGAGLLARASRRGRDGDVAATAPGQCARAARRELAGRSRPRTGPRRHRPRAPRRHHPGRREAPDRNLERRSIGPHGGVEGCRQGSRRSALVGLHRPPGRRQRRGNADGGEDLFWPHHPTGADRAPQAPHRSGGLQGSPLALRHRRRVASGGHRVVPDPRRVRFSR